ncbi:CAAX prenyl protease [Rhodotorula kratochvilovae]
MPLLSPTSTLLCSTAFTSAYLGSIYALPSTRVRVPLPAPGPARPGDPQDIAATVPTDDPVRRDRNHPAVIKARLLAASLATLASCAAVPAILQRAAPASYPSYTAALPTAAKLLGLALPARSADLARLLAYPLGLTASLFAGSFYVLALEGELPGQVRARTWASWRAKFGGWKGWRNYVLAPLTEELSFRSCIVAASVLGGWSTKRLIFITPLWFGLAHIHHAWETYLAGGRTRQALVRGIAQSGFQFLYTTLFGWYATFLFLRTGSILPPVLVHAFCNAIGTPLLGWGLKVYPEKKLSLWGSYLAGIGTFIYGFWRWTDPALFGGSTYWP